ncbi:flavin-containing monooxygenase [Teredinibacter sp. KSP-S5-2]|uniref:flavin-containing monooxygenase n=1 Tax=Teredinibacter sp. KSP-S5-2 TaxID=3034506 RepID=UPI0029346536|nr:NAD(P)-binding domain-containing protein [Teredinibacter sp. KSP-S5-2]WNO10786.1 NAD(P)-binding domain-containing protein [Teredinibacter sp. KSP-S5-2]
MSTTNNLNVCVIGAGSSGLVAIKELLDENHSVVCFEKYDQVGGNFYRNDEVKDTGAYDSTMLTISNYMMAFSSFPPPLSEKRKFWSGAEYQEYLNRFAQEFSLNECIQYNKEVISVKNIGSGDNDRYEVVVRSLADDSEQAFIFDAVAVCTGSSRVPKYVELKGKEKFKGEIYHSAYYKNAEPYSGRKVLCVGMGETGVDVVNELAGAAEKCVLSVRQYQPVIERFPLLREHTSDAYTSPFLYAQPISAANARMKLQFVLTKKYSKIDQQKAFADWNLKAGGYFNGFNIKSEIFVDRIVEDKLIINDSGVDYLEEHHVVFKDGRREEIDMVMLNTGYMDKFCFLKDVDVTDVRMLYKHMIHPGLGKGIVFIGWARPAVGGVPACSEMQSRYFALLCSGKKKLPEPKKLMNIIRRQAKYEDQVYHKNPALRSLVSYTKYMNDFAKVIGCSPWRIRTFLNPVLAYRLWIGSQMPTIYRLYGPHSDYHNAKKSIFNVPVAFGAVETVILTLYTVVTRLLASFRVITPDPKY